MWKIISPAQCSSVFKYSGDCMFDVAQMTTTQHQRRASAVHLAGLSILSHKHTGLLRSRRRQRNVSVLIDAFLTRVVLLSRGRMAAGILTVIINVDIIAPSHTLTSSDSVILCQVRDFSKLFTLLLH